MPPIISAAPRASADLKNLTVRRYHQPAAPEMGGWIWVWIALAIFGGEKREIATVDEYGNVTLSKV